MNVDYISNQQKQHKYIANKNMNISNKTVYYAHSIQYYNRITEQKDIKYIQSLKYNVVNPNGLNLGHSMMPYLLKVKDADVVYYRGDTIGVVLEVITAKIFNKPVYSLGTHELMSNEEFNYFLNIYKNFPYMHNDISMIKSITNEQQFSKFTELIGDAIC